MSVRYCRSGDSQVAHDEFWAWKAVRKRKRFILHFYFYFYFTCNMLSSYWINIVKNK